MGARPLVLCADLLPPAMRALMAGQDPAEVDLLFVETADDAEKIARARGAG